MYGLSSKELSVLKPLTSPEKIQDFLDTLSVNFELERETCHSPRLVLRERTAHCMEGAMFAALALRLIGHPPLVMDLKVTDEDHDHVVAIFKVRGNYGAISKTNHGAVRYRDPVYATLRELAMSYFHEYTSPRGTKILRSYSGAVDLSRFDDEGWVTSEKSLVHIADYVDQVRHYPLVTPAQIKLLRRADAMERKLGLMTEWTESGKKIR